MRKPAFVLFCWLALAAAAPAPPCDISKLPDAAAARQRGLNACQARQFSTLRANVDCTLTAHRAYALTEHLRDMALFNAYAAGVTAAANDADAGRISVQEAQKRAAAARATYQDQVTKLFAAYRAQTAGKSPPFDRAALPAALTAHNRAVKACGPWGEAKAIEAHTACVLAAGKVFTNAIRFQDMDLFYGYASFLRVDAVDAEMSRRPPQQMGEREKVLWADFLRTVEADGRGGK